jgi:hypothetical protein
MDIQVPLLNVGFISFRQIIRGGVAGLYCRSIFSFAGKLHVVFSQVLVLIYSHQLHLRVAFFPHLHQHFDFLKIIAILNVLRWNNNEILICSSLTAKDFQIYFFIYLLAICSSFEKNLFRLFSHLLIELLINFFEFFIYSGYQPSVR